MQAFIVGGLGLGSGLYLGSGERACGQRERQTPVYHDGRSKVGLYGPAGRQPVTGLQSDLAGGCEGQVDRPVVSEHFLPHMGRYVESHGIVGNYF